jgi:hypothetical protein
MLNHFRMGFSPFGRGSSFGPPVVITFESYRRGEIYVEEFGEVAQGRDAHQR